MPLARLELAPRVNPDWILSPTRLPIPPQGHAVLKNILFSTDVERFYPFDNVYNNTDIINCLALIC